MEFLSTKFGRLTVESDRIILFPDGLIGYEDHRHWILLSEGDDESVGWLQSLSDAGLAFLVVTPERFIPSYELRIHRSQLLTLPWAPEDRSMTLAIVSDNNGTLTANLKAPLAVNVDRCLGRQVIASDDQPLRYELTYPSMPLRKSA